MENEFKWNVMAWDINQDALETYDVVPRFMGALEELDETEKPKTKEEFNQFLEREARYNFWSKCEWEVIIHSWPKFKNDRKVDVYEQLKLNWDVFVDAFWEHLKMKSISTVLGNMGVVKNG